MPDTDHRDGGRTEGGQAGGGEASGGRIGLGFERHPVVQSVGAAAMIVFIAFLLLWNLPAGRPRQDLSPVVNPVVQALGMEQFWQVFAPNPRDQTLRLTAEISFAGGRTQVVTPPRNGVFVAPYRTYRWQKLAENLCFGNNQSLLQAASWWFARQAGPGVRTVRLACTTQPVVPPGGTGPPAKAEVKYPYRLVLP